MARFATTITRTGPFFEKDPAKTFRQNADVLMEAIASEGERDVQAQTSAFKAPSGAFREGVKGRTHRLDGAPFKHPGVVVSQTRVYAWKSAGSRQYRGGKAEAIYHLFRRTRSRIRAVNKLNAAELLKGLNP